MAMARKTTAALLAIAFVLGESGCLSVQDRALAAASNSLTCPKERITVTLKRNDHQPQPPPEIAADPARLAIWQKQQPDPSNSQVFSASGCGQAGVVFCNYEQHSDATGNWAEWGCAGAASSPSP